MDNIKDIVVDEIIHSLSPLKTLYNDEFNKITTDLLNYNLDSLIQFINIHYQDISYSEPIKKLVYNLVNDSKIPKNYLDKIKTMIPYTIIDLKNKDYTLLSSRPLNVKQNTLDGINRLISSNQDDIKEDDNQEDSIDYLRKKIFEAQLNYLNDAKSFIEQLEESSPDSIYQTLLNLNDIRYIQHCISNLNFYTLSSLFDFIKAKLSNNNHTSIDIFIAEVIKKNLHRKTM